MEAAAVIMKATVISMIWKNASNAMMEMVMDTLMSMEMVPVMR